MCQDNEVPAAAFLREALALLYFMGTKDANFDRSIQLSFTALFGPNRVFMPHGERSSLLGHGYGLSLSGRIGERSRFDLNREPFPVVVFWPEHWKT